MSSRCVKKFATSLFSFIVVLYMTYDFLHCNLSNALPSLRAVQRIVSDNYEPVQEEQCRFSELLQYLESCNTLKIVSIREDATRLISRVGYDSEINRLVGFVLLCNNTGLPLCNSFIVDSFQSMESCFQTSKTAKYAFVYMARSLTEGIPSLYLACLGTDDKFSADVLLKRWRCIFTECEKRGIKLASFGANGDSRKSKTCNWQCTCTSQSSPWLVDWICLSWAFHPSESLGSLCKKTITVYSMHPGPSPLSCETKVN